jgi:hypothetical protein
VGEKEGIVLFCGCDSFGQTKISELDRSRNESRLGLALLIVGSVVSETSLTRGNISRKNGKNIGIGIKG